jgi:hypothetical protein
MRSHYGAIALAISLAATAALAQSGGSTTTNPAARNSAGDVFFYGPLDGRRGQPFGRGALDDTGIGRPNPRNQHQVTPVPEPSQWALMLAGLALVGFMVRRGTRSPRNPS